MNLLIQSWSEQWLDVLWRASLHAAAAISIALAIVYLLTRIKTPAWVEHWLWKIVLVKLLLLLVITRPVQLPVLAPLDAANVVLPASVAAETIQPAAPWKLDQTLAAQQVANHAVSNQTTSPNSVGTLPSWQTALVFAWLMGVVANLLVLFRQFLATYRLKTVPVNDTALNVACKCIAQSQGLAYVPELATSDQVSSPALVGWLRPRIVFPPETLKRCTADQLRGVLAHELSHYRRADLWWNLLPAASQVFFYFHPLLWIAHRRWRLSSEMACDARAIEDGQNSISQYADSLLRIAQLGSHRLQSRRCLGCVSVFDSSRSLKQRVIAMKDYQADSTRKAILFAAGIALIAVLGIVPWQLVSRAAEPQDPDSSTDAVEINVAKNMDFESKDSSGEHAQHWGGGGEGYQLTMDDRNPHSGKRCARIEGTTDSGFGTYTQCFDPKSVRGKRIRFSGFLRSDLQGNGGLWMRIDGPNGAIGFDNMRDRRVEGKSEWTKHDVVLDVPAEATNICFGFLMVGKGDLWADDFTIDVVGDAGAGPTTTGMKQETFALGRYDNMDFEQESGRQHQPIKSWGGGGRGYELSRDTSTKHSGSASARIKRADGEGGFGTITQACSAEEFLGKRVRYTGFLKTEEAQKSGLWMRVDGPSQKVLSFDNMQSRPVTGTTDWKEYTIVLDVPEQAKKIAFGFLLIGNGTVWADDLKFEVVGDVGKGPKTTSMAIDARPTGFLNGGFEKGIGNSAANWGGGGAGYTLVRDTDEKHSGNSCGRISKESGKPGNFATFTQMFTADKHRGKRVQLSGFLKTDEAATTGLWMRIDGPEKSKPLGFDNMTKRPVKGTTDWTEYSVVLDVPEDATHIALGFLLIGGGTVWGDDLKLDVVGGVGEGPETTNMPVAR